MSKQLLINEIDNNNDYSPFVEYITDDNDANIDVEAYVEDKCSGCDHWGSCTESDMYEKLHCSDGLHNNEDYDDIGELPSSIINQSVADRLRGGE